MIIIFDVSQRIAIGYPPELMLFDYDFVTVGFMGLGLLFTLFTPTLAAKARGFVPQPSMTIREKLLIGVLLPVLLSPLEGFVAMYSWLFADLGPAGRFLNSLWLSGLLIPTVALLNLWVLPIRWQKTYQCFLAGMCVPAVAVVVAFAYGRTS